MRAHKIPECTKSLFSAQNDHKIDCFDSPDGNAELIRPMRITRRTTDRMSPSGWSRCPPCSLVSVYLKRSAVAIAPDSMLSRCGLGCFLFRVRSANQVPVRPPFETQFRGRALMAIAE